MEYFRLGKQVEAFNYLLLVLRRQVFGAFSGVDCWEGSQQSLRGWREIFLDL